MMNGKSISSDEWRLKQSSSARARPWITLLCIAAISLPGAELLATNKNEVSHVAFIWLKRSGNRADQQALIRAAKSFRKIHGVVRVDAVIVFCDCGALENYERDPRHLAAMREILKPLAKRYVIYNFSSD